ncbi:carbonic anhydrase [Spirosoma endophyticum]|uniref:Carbonic anhydrase n=1 Tax=Spirosoma endophyticum TaxID=662367 RepID=A0A1I2AMK3_9BACT|nr:carbonic anhydrase [Spirosoma endophyticum]SFE45244.1 carbonic anhydrase [Spirosoma endophyticum]
MNLYDRVFSNNKEWVQKQLQLDPTYFSGMAKGQTPEFLYIGCSDSRVAPDAFMGVKPGDVFIHRNIANLVPNNDISSLAVLQYAVESLQVKHIIVCGHYGCGGVKAATTHDDFGYMNTWLRNIQDVYRMYRDELDALEDPEARHRRLVELNVREQCMNVMKLSFVQKRLFDSKDIKVHGWVYDLANGELKDMEVTVDDLKPNLDIYRFKNVNAPQ